MSRFGVEASCHSWLAWHHQEIRKNKTKQIYSASMKISWSVCELRLIHLLNFRKTAVEISWNSHRTSWWHSWKNEARREMDRRPVLYSLFLRGIPQLFYGGGRFLNAASCQKQSLFNNLLWRAKNSASIPLNLTPPPHTHISKSSTFQWRINLTLTSCWGMWEMIPGVLKWGTRAVKTFFRLRSFQILLHNPCLWRKTVF